MTISPPLPPHTESDSDPDLTDTQYAIPPFPTHCLPGVAGEMAREISRVTTSQNEPLAVASVLGVISAAMGAGLQVNTGGERETRGNLYILPIAESGTGKGEAYKLAAAPFETAAAEAAENFDMHTRPGLVAELRIAEACSTKLGKDAVKESDRHARHLVTRDFQQAEENVAEIKKKLAAAPRWKVSDITKEQLGIVMQGQPGEAVASMSSEARGIIDIVKGRYGKEGGDEGFYCSAYSGDSIGSDRVSRDNVTLRHPCLSILWMIQPDAARKAFGEESFTESGLLPRFLMFDAKAEAKERLEQPSPIPVATKDAWAMLIRSLAVAYRMEGGAPRSVSVSPEAHRIMLNYENENVRRRSGSGDLRDIAPFTSRWTENAWRVALVLHTAQHGGEAHTETLDITTAENAVEVTRWFSERQLEILSSGRWDKMQKRLSALNALLAQAKGEISFGQLKRSNGFEEKEIRHLLSIFPNAFGIEERKPKIGRPHHVVTNKRPLEDIKE
jgi:hypothetical protein